MKRLLFATILLVAAPCFARGDTYAITVHRGGSISPQTCAAVRSATMYNAAVGNARLSALYHSWERADRYKASLEKRRQRAEILRDLKAKDAERKAAKVKQAELKAE